MSSSSPCVSICEVEYGRCIGCGRTETEIAEWRDYPEAKRLAIMDRLEEEAAAGGWFAADAFDAPAVGAAVGTAGASTDNAAIAAAPVAVKPSNRTPNA
ncbi:DUF1289 domain-containing protein [Guyparkeria sp.]|uniref:DUF1289 domain-containing protein n=1 Tax=Guyparkeria sp. TaxID=2035736 RepID=UPI0039705816